MTDEEIFDALDVPADRRVELRNLLHAWSRANLPGPNLYSVMACIYWNMLKRQAPLVLPVDTFDTSAWEGTVDPSAWLGTVRGAPWIDYDYE